MTEHRQNVTLTDIAELAGVNVSAASNWRKRHADFPRPNTVSGQEFFAADEVADWLSRRRIARNSLRPDESHGTTYGDRFLRGTDMFAWGSQARQAQARAEVRHDWTSQLWHIMNLLRNDLEPVSAFDFIMAMLYLRTTDRERWREFAQQPSPETANRILRDIRLPGYDVPLVTTADLDFSGKQQLVEAVRLFDEVDLDKVGSASMFDVLLEGMNRDLGRHGGHFTPPSVVRFMLDVLGPQSTDTVYDPSCGSGELLVAATQRGVGSMSGQAMNGRSLRMTLLNMSMHSSEAKLRLGGPEVAQGAFAGRKFDVVLSNPPFGITLPDSVEQDKWPFGVPTKRAGEFAWLQLAVLALKPGGRGGVLMPNGTLFSRGANADIRRAMVDNGVVEGIVGLPAGLFAATGIPVSLWLLRRPKLGESSPSEILIIDASGLGATSARAQRVLRESDSAKIVRQYQSWCDFGRSGNFDLSVGFARSVGIEEIRRNEYDLQPSRYVRGKDDSTYSLTKLKSLQQELAELAMRTEHVRGDVDAHLAALVGYNLTEWRPVPLGGICEVQAGPNEVDRERGVTMEGWTRLVLPRNIKRGHLSHEELDTVSPEESIRLAKYGLRSGDIVCPRSGTLGRHSLVREAESGWLLGPSCMRLRPRGNDIVSEYLVHFLNSSAVHEWVISQSRHTAIPYIRTATVRNLVVPLPPVEVQRAVIDSMESINVHIEQHQRAILTTQSLRDVVFSSLTQS
ncbi:N-6 DNA methylase [Amycolatopsis sp. NPDC059021]|uniref:N-6 DNA methylase n=1 Tax=Amycolatopsis sp. NPDC059021 TaxID=3346704 RepID=UPI003671C428